MFDISKQHVKRAVTGKDITFEDETTLPKLNNLASHLLSAACKKKQEEKDGYLNDGDDEKADVDALNLKYSAKLMASYLAEGELNPAVVATQKGFYRMFAAWILDESLPWTTGEAPSLAMLFRYLKVQFQLPTDTTVRNYLEIIFAELHAKVVREFSVS